MGTHARFKFLDESPSLEVDQSFSHVRLGLGEEGLKAGGNFGEV